MAKILIVEDNLETQFLLKKILGTQHQLGLAFDLKSAWSLLAKGEWDLILLDRSLPDGDGLEFCQQLKKTGNHVDYPVLMLTGFGTMDEKIEGLTAGTDDYVVKPFEPRELLLRVEALLRRSQKNKDPFAQSKISMANLLINMESQSASVTSPHAEPKDLDLTPIEFKILLTLVKNFGQEVEREKLIQGIWDNMNLSERNIDTHVCHLRKKMSDVDLQIKNRRGKGYYLVKKENSHEHETENRETELPFYGRNSHGNITYGSTN